MIHFLSYMNRSGSTLLAKKLNTIRDISVGIEINIGSKIRNNFKAENDEELEYWLQKVYRDVKFQSWNIEINKLKKNLLSKKKPIFFRDFLEESLKMYFSNSDSKILIHKSKYYFRRIDVANKVFPGSKFVFIERDPRAIFNSMSKSINSITGKVMKEDVIKFALHYKRLQSRKKHFVKSKKFSDLILSINYEDLLVQEDFVLKKISDFFGVSDKKETHTDYFDKIPEDQKHLHSNLNRENMTERITAWKNELDDTDADFLNLVLRKELKEKGYETTSSLNLKILFRIVLINKYIRFLIRFYPKHIAKEILMFLNQREVY